MTVHWVLIRDVLGLLMLAFSCFCYGVIALVYWRAHCEEDRRWHERRSAYRNVVHLEDRRRHG